MALFQSSVLNKYLKSLDQDKVNQAWEKFTTYFHNPAIQENIKNAKEEQYQEGFLRELFVKVLGYTLNPEPDFNLTTEFKNLKGSKKADGAILQEGKAIGVIELKGTNTTDLDKIEGQAFGYKNNQPNAIYVVTSNFEKLRFYIDNAVEYEEFNLFQLQRERFDLLWLCLAQDSVFRSLPKRIKDDSLQEEENVTKKLYKDYSTFRKDIFESIVKKNPDYDKLILFKKTQKLLDRFLFIFFAEDRLLLPPNAIRKIIDQWVTLRDELDAYTPLYERFQKYFTYLMHGRPKNGNKDEIFAYNGGLFEPDEILDNIKIEDDILYKHTLNLSHYDYETEVDVNILGHIFEHSLNEIEEIASELEGQEIDKKKTKRKKDGVFYTPKYITKYIVENTVGKLCEEKKAELELLEADFTKDYKTQRLRKNKEGKRTNLSVEGENLYYQIEAYREYLLSLTICDPACGSGAFLNQALEFLIHEHSLVDEMQTKVMGGAIVFPDVENSILENNLFGVDINEESVEIARLSLWLRTAKKGRQLTSLNDNIKCGNSLIDDPEVAGDKAFDWEKEFSKVFAKGGFDVVVGNPPYVNMVNIEDVNQRKYFQKNYVTAKNKCDLYSLFTEKGSNLLRALGVLGFIIPNSWMGTSSFSKFRQFITQDKTVLKLVELPPGVFKDAIVTTVIMIIENQTPSVNHEVKLFKLEGFEFQRRSYALPNIEIQDSASFTYSFEKKFHLKCETVKLGDVATFSLGIKTSNDKRFIFDRKIDNDTYPMLRGKNIGKYQKTFGGDYIWYKPDLIKEKPGGRPRVLEHYLKPKILIQDVAKNINATFDGENYLVNDTINIIHEVVMGYNIFYVLGLLNAKVVDKWFNLNFPVGLHIKINQLQEIPIPKADSKEQKNVAEKVETVLGIYENLNLALNSFIRLFTRRLNLKEPSKKLQNWHLLTFDEFTKELRKKKITLSLSEETKWEDYFEKEKAKAQSIQETIDKIENEINQIVYQLYGLTEEEIQIVENS